MHIVELKVSNIKRLKAITIRPDGNMVTIAGRNGQGKSSTLDAIEMALSGGRSIPPEPIRHGQRKARVVADLGEIVVERTFDSKGTKLVVKNKDGVPQRSPQAILDELCTSIAFDPLEFSRMDSKRQDNTLRECMGLDTTDLDAARAKAFAERTNVNRDRKRLAAQLEAMPRHSEAPEVPVDVAALTDELDQLQELAEENEEERNILVEQATTWSQVEEQITATQNEITLLRAKLSSQQDARRALEAQIEAQKVLVNGLVDPDVAALKARLRQAGDVNAQVSANKAYERVATELQAAEETAEQLSERLAEIDAQAAQRLAEAKFPIEGLAFDPEVGPTLKGVPLEQACQSDRLRLSVAVGLALHPQLRVLLIREGSFLDDDSMRLLGEFAEANDAQLWVERVASGPGGGAVYIEDGEVSGASSADDVPSEAAQPAAE